MRALEELAVERFRLLEHGAGFVGHLVFRVTHHKNLGKLALDPSARLIGRKMMRLNKTTGNLTEQGKGGPNIGGPLAA